MQDVHSIFRMSSLDSGDVTEWGNNPGGFRLCISRFSDRICTFLLKILVLLPCYNKLYNTVRRNRATMITPYGAQSCTGGDF